MHTTHVGRAETRSITIDAAPADVHALVADPLRLPDWAPAFAERVEPDGDGWLVNPGPSGFRIFVRSSPEHGTMDLVSTRDPRRGAFTRVVPNGEHSGYLFTLCFPSGTESTAIAAQMAELERVRALCERR